MSTIENDLGTVDFLEFNLTPSQEFSASIQSACQALGFQLLIVVWKITLPTLWTCLRYLGVCHWYQATFDILRDQTILSFE